MAWDRRATHASGRYRGAMARERALLKAADMKSLACLVFLVPAACGGRALPTASGRDDASDDGAAYGGTIAPIASGAVADDGAASFAPPGAAVGALDSGLDGGAPPAPVVPPAGPPFDAGPGGVCALPLAPGDLAIDELMIESVAGAGDHGEWLEVVSRLPCATNLRGLHGECPRGAKAATFDVAGDLWIPALGTFVVADSVSPPVNHDVPAPVVAWRGNQGDVLRNKGSTVTLRMHDVVIDTLTYPALPVGVGASLAFPADCDPSTRSDFGRWQTSVGSWFPGFRGTPNAPNTDVACAM
jgi:hypothetical protein